MKNALLRETREKWTGAQAVDDIEFQIHGGSFAPKETVTKGLLYGAMQSVFVSEPNERPRRCFLCIGKAYDLPEDDSTIASLMKPFYTSSDLSRHFRRKHLINLGSEDCIYCRVCEVPFEDMMRLQRHAFEVHDTISCSGGQKASGL
ncbi:hypothetical protein S40293_11578 [Stachybotrys chartarum IBT 40293]|nr:hypothetical protein S40293_11578 [Stachybotrys chartarum IBT 40293]